MSKETAAIRDQLGNDPDTFPVLNADYFEELGLEEQATKIITKVLGDSWIVGSSTNGIVGTNTGTQGGGQQVVGASGRTETLQRVLNPNNIFNERFIFTTFNDSGTTTADWGVVEGQLDMTNTEIAQSDIVAKDGVKNITKATITLDDTTNVTATISSDGGSNFEAATFGVEHTFTNIGTELKFKLTASGVATVKQVRIVYSE